MISLIETNPRLTLSEIRTLVSEAFDLNISTHTVARHLESLTYTLKTESFKPERANSPSNKEKRKLFKKSCSNTKVKTFPLCLWMSLILTFTFHEQKEGL
ncbi:hypothetical protein CDIK_3370 [Cucumispora dikerogammari]|nr:hypothetical protein CDIK_3370 [Cucumispora dikerogammari]